ncbi:hypothetical protein ACO1O0_005811 [Amphichorda felina]
MAGLIGAAQASLLNSDLTPATFDLNSNWDNEVLFKGVAGPASGNNAAIELDLSLREAQVEGDISIAALDDFLVSPSLRLDLAGVKAYFEIDLSASAAVFHTVQLVASPALEVDAGLLELTLGAAFALDLVVAVDAAIDITAGFYVAFEEGDFIDISILTKDITDSSLNGLVTKALPVSVGVDVDLSAEIEVQLGLRLRSHVAVEAGVELLDLDVIEAGVEVALWVDLLTHTIILVQTDDCILSIKSEFFLRLGLAVELNVEILDILDISLAPSVTIILAHAIGLEICLPDRGEPPVTPTGPPTGIPSGPPTDIPSGTPTDVPSGTPTDIPSGTPTGTPSGVPTSDASSPVTPTGAPTSGVVIPTGAPNGTTSDGGLITSTITHTQSYTITSCHVSVPNCPASQTQVIVTSTIVSSVTVCPADQTAVPTTTPTKKPVHTLTETLTTVVPCKPTTSTYTPPPGPPATPVPTITMSDTVTVPEESATPAPSGGVPTGGVPTGGVPGFVPTKPVVPNPTFAPSPNNTWTSLSATAPPPASWTPPPSSTPSQPTPPPTGGVGSLKVGFAMAVPAVLALML